MNRMPEYVSRARRYLNKQAEKLLGSNLWSTDLREAYRVHCEEQPYASLIVPVATSMISAYLIDTAVTQHPIGFALLYIPAGANIALLWTSVAESKLLYDKTGNSSNSRKRLLRAKLGKRFDRVYELWLKDHGFPPELAEDLGEQCRLVQMADRVIVSYENSQKI